MEEIVILSDLDIFLVSAYPILFPLTWTLINLICKVENNIHKKLLHDIAWILVSVVTCIILIYLLVSFDNLSRCFFPITVYVFFGSYNLILLAYFIYIKFFKR